MSFPTTQNSPIHWTRKLTVYHLPVSLSSLLPSTGPNVPTRHRTPWTSKRSKTWIWSRDVLTEPVLDTIAVPLRWRHRNERNFLLRKLVKIILFIFGRYSLGTVFRRPRSLVDPSRGYLSKYQRRRRDPGLTVPGFTRFYKDNLTKPRKIQNSL